MFRIIRILLAIAFIWAAGMLGYFLLFSEMAPPAGLYLVLASSLFGLIFHPRR
ncbi:MAG: hypothetical protein V2I43_01485 [Parvularcula sp.]|jgi:hypothetical protein|nr:hypothetical protein [Parvularcula sp.]